MNSSYQSPGHIIFIINPKSGTQSKDALITRIHHYMRINELSYDILYTEYAGHATEICKDAVEANMPLVIAVGGDGTVNECGKALMNTNTALGILPFGSGNGLARSLGISMEIEVALRQLFQSHKKSIDVGLLNHQPFFCTAGFGFDATVSYRFSQLNGRGIKNYIKAFWKEFRSYKGFSVKIKEEEYVLFSLTAANAPQFGNEAYIAPLAKLDDGLFHFSAVMKHPIWYSPWLALKMFFKNIHKSKYVKSWDASQMSLKTIEPIRFHLDGEPMELAQEFNFQVNEASLFVWIPTQPKIEHRQALLLK